MSVTDNVDIGDQTGNEIGGGAAKQNFASNLFLQVEKNNPAKMYVAIAVGIIVYLLIQLVTLTRSPLPWFDDTFFASIAESLYRNGELKLSVSPLWFDKPVYIYGPAYFVLTGAALQWFGMDVFAFRLPNLLFSVGILFLVFLLLRQRKISLLVVVPVCALLALDPIFYRGSHIGRMDSMALFFLLSSFYLLLKGDEGIERKTLWLTGLSGASAGIALITTPRPTYLAALIGVILLYRLWRNRTRLNAIRLTMWTGLSLLPWLMWFFYAFGGIRQLWDYYASLPGGTYVGGFAIRPEHYPLLFGLLILLCVRLISSEKKLFDELLFFVVCGIAGYYLLIHDEGGAYAFFMMPLAYTALGVLAAEVIEQLDERLPVTVIGAIMLINVATYCARNIVVWLEWNARDPKTVEQAVAKTIPKGSRVVGDDKYYFAVKKSGSDFQYFGRGGSVADRTAYHRDVYRADFLIADNDGNSHITKAYIEALHMKPVGVIDAQPVHPFAAWIERIAEKFGYSSSKGYEGTIWESGRRDRM